MTQLTKNTEETKNFNRFVLDAFVFFAGSFT